MSRKHKLYATLMIVFLLGGAVGWCFGYVAALNWAVGKAVHFLELKGIEVDFNRAEIALGLLQYKNRINLCWPEEKENASIYNNTRN